MPPRPNPAVQSAPSPASVSSLSSSRSKRTVTASPHTADADAPEAPPKKVQKVSRACDHCKAKKLKCTGNIPCAGCTKRGLDCHYEAIYRRGRPPTPPPAPASASASASGVRARDQQVNATAGPSRTFEFTISGHETPAIPTSRASPELESSDIGGQYIDPTSNLTFLHRAWKRLSAPGRSASNSDPLQPITAAGDRPFTLPPSTSDTAIFLPDRPSAEDLVAYYFSTCVVTYRCLHQPTVAAWLDILLTNAETGFPLTHRLGNSRVAIVLCVFAIALLRRGKIATAGPPDDAEQARAQTASDQYFLQASGLSSRDAGLPGLEAAQARILQVLFLLQSSRMNQAWYIFGGTLPIVSALGLHRKPGRKLVAGANGGDYIAAQCRKRTFWVAYIIDKYLAVVFGRPRLYHDDDIDQDFPDRVNDEDMTAQGPSGAEPKINCHMDSTIAHAQLAQIIGNISREGYSLKPLSRRQRLDASHRFRNALRNWYSSLPAHLGPAIRPLTLTPLFRRQHTALKLAYCHAIMHASRPFLLGRDAVDEAVRAAIRECIAAAKSSLETVDAIVSDSSAFWAYWWTPYVTFCALAVVYVWEIQRCGAPVPQEDAPPGLFELAERCQRHLATSTEHGSLGWRYNVILEELRLEARRQTLRETDVDVQTFVQTDISTFTAAIPQVHNNSSGADASGSSSGSMYSMGAGMLDEWQPADWLDIDSSAFGPYPEFDSTMMWGFGEGGIQ